MRVVAILAALSLSGCFTDETQTVLPADTALVRGSVVDPLFLPVAGARVRLLDTNESATSGSDGTFVFPAVRGDSALVTAAAEGFEPATRRVSLVGGDATVTIVLVRLPVEEPFTVEMEHAGFISCAAIARVGEEGTFASCGERDPNDQRELEFDVPVEDGIAGAVLELSWEAQNPAASTFRFSASAESDGVVTSLGASEGHGYVRLFIPRSVASDVLKAGSVLRTRTEPAPSTLDEEAFVGLGLAANQPFRVIATLFYHGPPPPSYRAGG